MEEFLVFVKVVQVKYSEEKTLPELLTILYTTKLFMSHSFPIKVDDWVVLHNYDLFVYNDNSIIIQVWNSVEYLLLINDIHDPRFVSFLFSYDGLFNE